MSLQIPLRAAKRAAENFVQVDECHISTYSTGSHGYAQIGWQDKSGRFMTTAHRAAWVYARGQIPNGMTIDHICKNRRCIRVDHLRLLTNFENARRTSGRDWPLGQCANGHPNDELVVVANSGKRVCRKCRTAWHRKRAS